VTPVVLRARPQWRVLLAPRQLVILAICALLIALVLPLRVLGSRLLGLPVGILLGAAACVALLGVVEAIRAARRTVAYDPAAATLRLTPRVEWSPAISERFSPYTMSSAHDGEALRTAEVGAIPATALVMVRDVRYGNVQGIGWAYDQLLRPDGTVLRALGHDLWSPADRGLIASWCGGGTLRAAA